MPVRPPMFRPRPRQPRSEQRKQVDERRGSARARGYTAEWDKAAKRYIDQHPLCLGCEAVGIVVPSTLVDHVVPQRGDAERMWSVDNWQPSCRWHHDVVKKRLEASFDKGELPAHELALDSAAARALTVQLRPDLADTEGG